MRLGLFLSLWLSMQGNAWAADCGSARGVLVLAHGAESHGDHGGHAGQVAHGKRLPASPGVSWESTVAGTVGEASRRIPFPVHLSFGMWDRDSFQAGIDALAERGACRVTIIPLFVSSHSSVIRAQRYQFGLERHNPLPFDPGRVRIPPGVHEIRFLQALDRDSELTEILRERVRELSSGSAREEVVLVAHGPVEDSDDRAWQADLAVHARKICGEAPRTGPCRIRAFTLNDDAPPEEREARTRALRGLVAGIERQGSSALIVPVLLARGGIEEGLLERLYGLHYRYNGHMLAPDARLVSWLVRKAGE